MRTIPSWREDDGTEVWLVAGPGRGVVPDLPAQERQASAAAAPGAVLGANSEADDVARLAQLAALGYQRVFSMVELERDVTPVPRPTVAVDVRHVEPGDAEAMHALTGVVWADRAYFTMPTLSSYQSWVRDADPSLMLLAWDGPELVGYIAAEVDAGGLLIDDVQVHPGQQRRGVATVLVSHVVEQAIQQGQTRVHLATEGDDPVGARAFYERIGFTLCREELRFRKPA